MGSFVSWSISSLDLLFDTPMALLPTCLEAISGLEVLRKVEGY
jgi:hypothetical protein